MCEEFGFSVYFRAGELFLFVCVCVLYVCVDGWMGGGVRTYSRAASCSAHSSVRYLSPTPLRICANAHCGGSLISDLGVGLIRA